MDIIIGLRIDTVYRLTMLALSNGQLNLRDIY